MRFITLETNESTDVTINTAHIVMMQPSPDGGSNCWLLVTGYSQPIKVIETVADVLDLLAVQDEPVEPPSVPIAPRTKKKTTTKKKGSRS